MRKETVKRLIISLFHLTATVKEKRKEKYEKENGKKSNNNIFISSYGSGKRKKKRKYEKENGKRVIIIPFFHLWQLEKKKEKKI